MTSVNLDLNSANSDLTRTLGGTVLTPNMWLELEFPTLPLNYNHIKFN